MKKTAAWLAVHALEQLGVRFTFGIPGVHNTELYDELNNSKTITPVLVTHEGGAAFMADAVSRVSDAIGTLVIVPAAGVTHAASGIAEAFLDGIPMLVICGGIRTDSDRRYQLHEIDQLAFIAPLTKAAFRVETHDKVVPTIFEAYRIATSGVPGPVFVEIPVNLQLFPGDAGTVPKFVADQAGRRDASGAALPEDGTEEIPGANPLPSAARFAEAAVLLRAARHPGIFVGWGARDATDTLRRIAEHLQAPVATTLQGLSVFPANHPLHVGFGFGPAAVPAARNAFKDCDCMLAIGTRFAEIATGSFGVKVPENLVHLDIDPRVFDANYPAKIALACDAVPGLEALWKALAAEGEGAATRAPNEALHAAIARDKKAYRDEWLAHDSKGRVNPARFFDALRRAMPDDAIAVVDDGNHTYLTAELFPVHTSKALILPTDFNCMGYAVPAAIGAKLAQPNREVFAIVGDGAFLMTCMEIVTAARQGLGIVYYVFHDGELSQIAQAQETTFNRKPCTALGALQVEGVALATGAAFVTMGHDDEIEPAIERARTAAATGWPVIVDVAIDYTKRTAFTQGAVKTNFGRFSLVQKLRIGARALLRKLTG